MPWPPTNVLPLPCFQVFAPLARLLGLYSIKEELEALSFKHSQPDAHLVRCRSCRNQCCALHWTRHGPAEYQQSTSAGCTCVICFPIAGRVHTAKSVCQHANLCQRAPVRANAGVKRSTFRHLDQLLPRELSLLKLNTSYLTQAMVDHLNKLRHVQLPAVDSACHALETVLEADPYLAARLESVTVEAHNKALYSLHTCARFSLMESTACHQDVASNAGDNKPHGFA